MSIPESTLKEAWRLRKRGAYSMREIATKLDVNREQLKAELQAWLDTKPKEV